MFIDQLDEMAVFSKMARASVAAPFDEVTLPTACDEDHGVSRPLEGGGEIVNNSGAGKGMNGFTMENEMHK
jgi:hypothetical protein